MTDQIGDDDRFAQLIADEYGVNVDGPAVAEDKVHRPSPTRHWFSLDKAIDDAEPEYEPWERFTAPPSPPLGRPRNPLVIAGLCSFAAAIVIAVLWMAGLAEPVWLRSIGGLAIGAGLVCLLLAIPRHRTRDDDGAVL